jgi:hypothetical protein
MKLFRVLTCLAACLLIFAAVSVAQPPSPCNPCVTYCSYTQGGWGQICHEGNVGCLRNQCFTAIYPNGVTVGRDYPNGGYWIHLTTSHAVEDFLPQGTTPEALTQNYTDPGVGNITIFAGQVLALQLNVDYGAYGCGSMVDINGLEIASGPFDGWTVQELLDAANIALGGGPLPPGRTIAQLNTACTHVNENFDGCHDNDGYLLIPPMGETVIARGYGEELPVSFCLEFPLDCGDLCIMWWCPFCQPGDFANFVCCDNWSGVCPQGCNHISGADIEWGEQTILGPDESGNGCWWYTTAHLINRCVACYCVSFDFQLSASLIDFTAVPGNGQVQLNWSTASELDNARFDLQRSTDNTTWTPVGSVNGQGTSTITTTYSYVDNSVTNGVTYQYQLVSVGINGNSQPVGNVVSATPSVGAATPHEFALHQNYPNPFNPTTQIRFDIAEASYVTLKVFDVMGRELATLVDGNLAANRYEVSFDASALSSGTYFYRLNAGSFTSMNKMLVLK